jgi:hypothetical protein
MRALTFLLAAATLAASVGAVAASDRRPVQPSRYYGLYDRRSVGLQDQMIHRAAIADPSGTVGREDLGADPFHPEGPGTVQD